MATVAETISFFQNFKLNSMPGKHKDYTGCDFEYFTVLQRETNVLRPRWICQCHCGNTMFVRTSNLSKTKSCIKCFHSNNKSKNHYAWKGFNEISGHHFCRWKKRAREADIDFLIGIEDIYQIYIDQNKKCSISGVPLIFKCTKSDNVSLDRICSSGSYSKGNIQLVTKTINMCKWKFDNGKFIDICRMVTSPDITNNYNFSNSSAKKGSRWKGVGDLGHDYFTTIRKKAIQRKIAFDIDMNDMWRQFELQKGKCALTGQVLQFADGKINLEQTASLDRINSNCNYKTDNIQWVHKNLNIIKRDVPNEEFILMCKKVVQYNEFSRNNF